MVERTDDMIGVTESSPDTGYAEAKEGHSRFKLVFQVHGAPGQRVIEPMQMWIEVPTDALCAERSVEGAKRVSDAIAAGAGATRELLASISIERNHAEEMFLACGVQLAYFLDEQLRELARRG